MGRTWGKLSALGAVVACSVAFATPSDAGQSVVVVWQCSQSSNGGSCFGSLTAARNSSDPTAYAEFWSYSSPQMASFYGETNGTQYSCTFTGTPPPQVAMMSGNPNTYFAIGWNASGVCTQLELAPASLEQ